VRWGGRAASLRERLLEANTTTSKFRVLEDFLVTEKRRCPPLNSAVEFAVKKLQGFNSPRVSEITGELGMSPKHFIEFLNKQVGMTPKLFCRLQRFQRVVRFTGTVYKIKWKDFCLTCGYYDQVHLIHDFGPFSGCTPTGYLHRKTGRLNHVST
jgi:AraC-like DNA-binding protein